MGLPQNAHVPVSDPMGAGGGLYGREGGGAGGGGTTQADGAGATRTIGAGTGTPAAAPVATGTHMGAPHLGHSVFLPANSAFTEKLCAHPGHLKSITRDSLESSLTGESADRRRCRYGPRRSAYAGCRSAYCSRRFTYSRRQSAYHDPMSRTRPRFDVKGNRAGFFLAPFLCRSSPRERPFPRNLSEGLRPTPTEGPGPPP